MADQISQYLNPIIEAMAQSARGSYEAKQIASKNAEQAQAAKLRQQEIDQAHERIQNEHEHQTTMDQLDQQRTKAFIESHAAETAFQRQQALKQVTDMINSGSIKPSAYQTKVGDTSPEGNTYASATPQGTIDVPGYGNINLSAFPSAQEYAQSQADRIRATAAAQSGGTAEGQQPFIDQNRTANAQVEREAEENKSRLNLANRLQEIKAQGGNAQDLERVRAGHEESIANINGQYKLKDTMLLHQLGQGDPQGASSLANNLIDSIDNGQRAYSSLSQDEKRIVDPVAASRGWQLPSNQNSHVKNLNTIGGIDTLLNQYRDVIQKYSRDSPTNQGQDLGSRITQGLGSATSGTITPVIPGSDLQSKLDDLKSSGGQLASTYDQQNRKNDAEILRQITGLFSPKNTIQQNMQKLNDHAQQLQQIVKDTFAGMKPDQVNKILGDRGITNFGGIGVPSNKTAPATGTRYLFYDKLGNILGPPTQAPQPPIQGAPPISQPIPMPQVQ